MKYFSELLFIIDFLNVIDKTLLQVPVLLLMLTIIIFLLIGSGNIILNTNLRRT